MPDSRRHFDFDTSDIAARYDRGRAVTDDARTALLNLLLDAAPSRVARVLDLGGGTGRFAAVLRQAFAAPVVIVDPAANMIAAAAAKPLGEGVRIVRAAADRLPFQAQAFDMVFVSQVIHHLPDVRAAMLEMCRVLSVGGRLIVRQSTRENLDAYFYQRFFPEARQIDEGRLPGRAELIETARAAGFKLVGDVRTEPMEVGATGREYVQKVATRTNTDLAMISDEAFARGLERLTQYCREHPDHPRSEELDHFVLAPA